jgi:sugar transport protein
MEQNSTQWLIPIVVQLIPAGMLLVGAFFIPESPRWLFANGKRERAMKNLCWMRNLEPTDTYIIEEVSYVDEDIERFRREVGAGFWKPFQALKEKRILHRFFIGGMVSFSPFITHPSLHISRVWILRRRVTYLEVRGHDATRPPHSTSS